MNGIKMIDFAIGFVEGVVATLVTYLLLKNKNKQPC